MVKKHGGCFLYVVGAPVKERVEGKHRPFGEIKARVAPGDIPGNPFLRKQTLRGSGFPGVQADTDGGRSLQGVEKCFGFFTETGFDAFFERSR